MKNFCTQSCNKLIRILTSKKKELKKNFSTKKTNLKVDTLDDKPTIMCMFKQNKKLVYVYHILLIIRPGVEVARV